MPDPAPRDSDRNPGLIVQNTPVASPLVVSGFNLNGVGAIAMAIVDGSGNQITSFGGGTQYTDGGAAAAHPIGTGVIFNDGGTYTFVSAANPLPVDASVTISFQEIPATGLTEALAVQIVDGDGDQITSFGGGTQYATNVAYADGNIGTLALTIRDDALTTLTEADGDYSGLRVDSIGRLWANVSNTVAVSNAGLTALQGAISGTEVQVDVLTMPTVTVQATNLDIRDLNSGTDSVSAAQSGTWNITDISGTISLPTGAATLAEQQTQSASLSTLDDWDESDRAKVNPIVGQAGVQGGSGSVSNTTQRVVLATDVGLPAGTNNIGDVDILSVIPGTGATNLGKAEDAGHTTADVGVMALGVANTALAAISGTTLDYTPIATNLDGRVLTMIAPPAAMTRGTATTTGTSDTSLVAASGSGSLKTYITSIQIANTGSTTALITFKDGNGGSTLGYTIAPAGGGSNIKFDIPLVTTANTAFYFAAGSSSTTIYASAQGYLAP